MALGNVFNVDKMWNTFSYAAETQKQCNDINSKEKQLTTIHCTVEQWVQS